MSTNQMKQTTEHDMTKIIEIDFAYELFEIQKRVFKMNRELTQRGTSHITMRSFDELNNAIVNTIDALRETTNARFDNDLTCVSAAVADDEYDDEN